jgi:photosystem II stability/assembly factor-like uncharacterized protein
MLLAMAGSLAVPLQAAWESRGIGGGGALFSISLSPHDTNEIRMTTDMSSAFRSGDFGQRWETLDFRALRGGHNSQVRYTSDPDVLYAIDVFDDLNYGYPVRSDDAGETWAALAGDPTWGGEVWWLDADPRSTDRVLISDYTALHFSDDGGDSFRQVYEADPLRVAGSFWGEAGILVATQAGLLVSTDGGAHFARSAIAGIPADEVIVGFAAAERDGLTRLIAVTGADVYPGITGGDMLWDYRSIYRLDLVGGKPSGTWQRVTNGIGSSDGLYFAGMAHADPSRVYLAGGDRDTDAPEVYRSDDGGDHWNRVFLTENNANIATGWCGDDGDEQWWFPEYALGFGVNPADGLRAVITDLGFVHVTDDGGENWRQAYVAAADQHPPGSSTPRAQTYEGIGLQQTSVWWLQWSSAEIINAGYTDIQGQRSSDGGKSWQAGSSLGLPHNSTYQIVAQPGSGILYAATSSVHDLYQSTYLTDGRIDGGEGHVVRSTDRGANWTTLHDFGHPVIWLAFDPADANTLYASVVHSSEGGIYVTEDLHQGTAAQWQRLSAPPRTQGHPFNIHVLNDGTLVATYSGHRDGSGQFQPRSGVFVSVDGGSSWADRSHPDMRYWTKDLVIDPHDATQSTWLVGVFRHWGGGHDGLGGLYRTTDRGLSWQRISDLYRVESAAVDPRDPTVAYLATETDGLWRTTNLTSAAPTFTQDPDYPFQHPLRVFFSPYDQDQVWVASFGGGLRVYVDDGIPVTDCSGVEVFIPGNSVFPLGETRCVASTSIATGNPVRVLSGARVSFESPITTLGAGFSVERGALFQVRPR